MIKKSFLFMDTNKYIIINNPNEVNVNNAYNALKTLYKSVYRVNELLAYKALAKAINEGILAEIENNAKNHQILINAINNQSYSNDVLKELDIFPNDPMFDNEFTVNMNDINEKITKLLTDSKISYTPEHANNFLSIISAIDGVDNDFLKIDGITQMHESTDAFEKTEKELKNTISLILEANPSIDASKYDINKLQKTVNNNPTAIAKVSNKIITTLSKSTVDSPQGNKYFINVGGLNKDQLKIKALASAINLLYSQLYNESEWENAANYAELLNHFIQSFESGNKHDQLIELGINENKVNSLGTLDDTYIYTEDDKNLSNSLLANQKHNLETIKNINKPIQALLDSTVKEYEEEILEYPNKHNGQTYAPPIFTTSPKSMTANDDVTSKIEDIVKKANQIPEIVPITAINVDNTDITVDEGNEVTIHLSYEPENYTSFDASEINVSLNGDIIEKTTDYIIVRPNESGIVTISINEISVTVNITVQSSVQPPVEKRYYFGVSSNPIINNGVIDFTGFEQYTEDEFFNETKNDYKYRTIESNYPNFVKYILVPNEYAYNVALRSVVGVDWAVNKAFTDGSYMVFDLTDYSNGNGITANFELKLGGSSVNDNTLIETLEPQTTYYYYYAGWTLPSDANVDTIINETYAVSDIDSNLNTAGKKTTSKSSMDYSINTLHNANEKTNYYVLVPAGHSIYDILDTNISDSTFTSQGNITVGNQTHTIYKSNDTSRNISAIIIK